MKQDWFEFDGKVMPSFHDRDEVEVEYRSGRRAQGDQPWMMQGWQWRDQPSSTDIVRYRVVGTNWD
jgi:hypothetical protein